MRNFEIASILGEIGEYLSLQDEPFRPRAYRRAAMVIENLDRELKDIYAEGGVNALKEVPGIGQAIAEKVEELLKTGGLKYYEKLKKDLPVNLPALSSIEGLGPRKIKALHKALGIKTIDDLARAAKSHKIKDLAGFSIKSEDNILKGIRFHKSQGERMSLEMAIPLASSIKEDLESITGVSKVVIAGSLRRRRETVGDLDFLVISKTPEKVMNFFVSHKNVVRVLAKGDTKASVTLRQGIDADLRVVKKESYGAALAYFTGSKAHNIAMRKIAQSKGLKLNEYGLYMDEKSIAGETEEDIYRALGMQYVEPEMREDMGEMALALKNSLPKLINYSDLRGDMQVQSNWTDGKYSIGEMARKAMDMGLEYILITDHSQNLKIANGLDEKRLAKQGEEIDMLNEKLGNKFRILKGVECDILKDGTLDLKDEALLKLDVVGASVHTYFNLPKKAQTERIKKAMESSNVDIIFHPTGRRIGRRPPYEVDIEELISFAKTTKTVMEIDGFPDRLDLKDEHIRMCVKKGVKMSISSDAHSKVHMEFLDLGVAQARRGWATKADIINTQPVEKMLSSLKG
ncbi:MAG: DNA polymerase III [Candidatus Colwellbacteria bacterium CG10_big_fil_rev_8_21_14_0_10_42_22]|uniref:DNA polymerase beta n=1 Tax=Candidatus Colwellbacteria bacterium CG10_big_fil_rev_8_21_14_0_10_42_22 TaxID=1974540 RepID=A0A2H0VFT7_9BACT|nr:MAG: DNA polymerase III [Candidatus Colwellbacteria bacterium CG10_big_fil_rev_8_21_14_0_10_42_22]